MSRRRPHKRKPVRPRSERASAAVQRRAPARAQLESRIVWESPIFGYSGYDFAARTLITGLLDRGLDVDLRPISPPPADTEFADLLSHIDARPAGANDIFVAYYQPCWTGPNNQIFNAYKSARWKNGAAGAYVGYTTFETDRIDPAWVQSLNQMDEVWVVSPFNRDVFVRCGVNADKVHVIPHGIDASKYGRAVAAPLALPEEAGFKFLSVFQWMKHKGYDVLLKAYAREFTSDDDVALYVRTSKQKWQPGQDPFDRLQAMLLAEAPDPARAPRLVPLRERISDADMPSLYAACDAFVLPTRGEGWGIPYMEAMASGLPTIGTNWGGNTAFMTEQNSYLIDLEGMTAVEHGDIDYDAGFWGHRVAEPSVEHVQKLMREVFEHRDEARARGRRAAQDVAELWTRENAVKAAADRLAALRTTVNAHKRNSGARILWSAPLADNSGYAEEARGFVQGLDSIGAQVRTNPIRWSTDFAELEPSEEETLKRLERNRLDPQHVHVQHIFPKFFVPDGAAVATVGRAMFETDRVPAEWVARCNMMDEIWVPSEFNRTTFANAGVNPNKLQIVPESINADRFLRPVEPLLVRGRRKFNFLTIFDWSLRKGWDVLLNAYLNEFGADEDVSLTIKTYSSHGKSHQQLEAELRTFVRDSLGLDPMRIAPILLMFGVLKDRDLVRLYRAADAFVLPSRGEGWGRPLMEAMACGLPTIGTNWSGNTAFMHEQNSYLLDYDLVPVSPEAVAEAPTMAGHRWAEPSVDHLRRVMREIVNNPDGARSRAAVGRAEVLEKFARRPVAHIAAQHAERILGRRIRQLPVTWEGSQFLYHSLAHVNRELCLSLMDSGEVDLSVVPFGDDQFDGRADPKFGGLAERVNVANATPTRVHVRHQWPPKFEAPASDAAWVMVQPWEYGSIPAEWVAPMRDQVDEIWVPSNWVRDCYVQSGVPAERVKVIPNGVNTRTFAPEGTRYPLKTKKTRKLLFVGGTIARKGIDVLLDAYTHAFTSDDDVCLVIKSVGADSFYRGLDIDQHIKELAHQPGLPEIELISAALTEPEMASLYRACDALVHPYRGEGFGMPIAEAMACDLPVVVTDYGACLDFCTPETAFLVPATELPVISAELPKSSAGYWWAEPDRERLIEIMRQVVTDRNTARAVGRRGGAYVRATLPWNRVVGRVLERIKVLSERTPRRFERAAVSGAAGLPFPLEGRRRSAYLHHPRWTGEAWREVVKDFARAFTTRDDVTLVLWLDPSQGVSEAQAGEYIIAALAESGVDPNHAPDMLLVPDALDAAGQASLYAAVDWVVPAGDSDQVERAVLSGARVLHSTAPAIWRTARWTRQDGEEQLDGEAPLAA